MFATSGAFNDGKWTMNDVLNATLAGGVTIGASADMVLSPGTALLIGFLAGLFSVFGFNKVTSWLNTKCNVFDSFGVNALHAFPGLIGGIIAAFMSLYSEKQYYGDATLEIWPARKTRETGDQCGF